MAFLIGVILAFVYLHISLIQGNNLPEVFAGASASVREHCVEVTGVDEEKLDNLANGFFPRDRPLMCYLKCSYDMIDLLRNDGSIDPVKALNIFPEDLKPIYQPIYMNCKDIVGTDPCETVFLTSKCHYETNPQVYFHF